jgi:hypothetical protein
MDNAMLHILSFPLIIYTQKLLNLGICEFLEFLSGTDLLVKVMLDHIKLVFHWWFREPFFTDFLGLQFNLIRNTGILWCLHTLGQKCICPKGCYTSDQYLDCGAFEDG